MRIAWNPKSSINLYWFFSLFIINSPPFFSLSLSSSESIRMNNNQYRALKCPYCPLEQSISDAKQIFFWRNQAHNSGDPASQLRRCIIKDLYVASVAWAMCVEQRWTAICKCEALSTCRSQLHIATRSRFVRSQGTKFIYMCCHDGQWRKKKILNNKFSLNSTTACAGGMHGCIPVAESTSTLDDNHTKLLPCFLSPL